MHEKEDSDSRAASLGAAMSSKGGCAQKEPGTELSTLSAQYIRKMIIYLPFLRLLGLEYYRKSYFVSNTLFGGRSYEDPHAADEQTEAQRGEVTCPRSHSRELESQDGTLPPLFGGMAAELPSQALQGTFYPRKSIV